MDTINITPKFGDIDGLGHVNNTVMPGWFEQARNPIYRIFNPDFDFGKWNLILAHYDLDFINQLFFNKNVAIRTKVTRIGNSSFNEYQEAWQDETIGAKGNTVLVYFDFETQKPTAIPTEIRTQLEAFMFIPETSEVEL